MLKSMRDNCVEEPHAGRWQWVGLAVSAGCYAFYALVGEASGRCHGNIDALARYLAQFVDATLRKQFRKEFVVEFAVALMRGNARIVSHALDRIRTGKIFGHPRCY